MEDLELKRLGESIARKEVALIYAKEREQTIFDLEISRLKDEFEGRCMLLLAIVLALNDRIAIKEHIEMIQNAACVSMRPELFVNLYKNLVRYVLFELKDAAKMAAIEKMEMF